MVPRDRSHDRDLPFHQGHVRRRSRPQDSTRTLSSRFVRRTRPASRTSSARWTPSATPTPRCAASPTTSSSAARNVSAVPYDMPRHSEPGTQKQLARPLGAALTENGPMKKLSDRDLVAREYATVDRLAMRRLDRTAWLGGEHEPWMLALAAIAEARPSAHPRCRVRFGRLRGPPHRSRRAVRRSLTGRRRRRPRERTACSGGGHPEPAVPRRLVRCGGGQLGALPRPRSRSGDRRARQSAHANRSLRRLLQPPATCGSCGRR